MASSYALPPLEGTTLFTQQQHQHPHQSHHGRSHSHSGHTRSCSGSSVHLSPGRLAGGSPYMNGNSNGSFAKKASPSSASLNLYTHAEASNETTPQPSPIEEFKRPLPSSTYNSHASHLNGHSHTHTHKPDHSHDHDHDHSHSHSHSPTHGHSQSLPASHGHSHGHTPSPSPMKSRPRGESDLGRPAGSLHPQIQPSASASWFSLPEALTSLLISLPYMLASAAYHPGSDMLDDGLPPLSAYQRLQHSVLEEGENGEHGLTRNGSSLVEACMLTAGTLLLVGIVAKVRSNGRMLDRRKDKVETPQATSLLTFDAAGKMLVRALAVGLPFYATTHIGGMRTSILLLIAIASGLTNIDSGIRPSLSEWRRMLTSRIASVAVVLLAIFLDFGGITFRAASADLVLGYMALACSIFVLPPPLPTLATTAASSRYSGAATPTTPVSGRSPWSQPVTSPLVCSVSDVNITLAAGTVVFFCALLASVLLATPTPVALPAVGFSILSVAASAAAISFTQPSLLQSQMKLGLGLSCFVCAIFAFLFSPSLWPGTIFNGGLSALSYVGVLYDTTSIRHHDERTHEHAHNAQMHSDHHEGTHSGVTKYLMDRCQPGSLFHGILSEKDSRRIAYFTCLNFGFMIVQGIYGYLSGSLGLLSDTVHMFFDCLGLVVGLGAAVASKWPTSPERPYGWGKLNTLAGFGNGIFLMLVSVEFAWEAMEGIVERKELRHVEELLVVSTLGFLVNMVGLFAFGHAHAGHDHGHGHSHSHGHSHDHSHSHAHDHGHSHGHAHDLANGHSRANSMHSHKSSGGSKGDIHGYCDDKHGKEAPAPAHGHDHNDNMHGIFLHVAADAGGSAAVIISTAMTLWKPWYLWDPLATIIIAILIFAAAVPLVVSSGQKLLLVIPDELEYNIKNTLQELGELRGVLGYAVPRFWLDDKEDSADAHGHHHHHGHDHGSSSGGGSKVQGVIHIISHPGADLEDVRHRVDHFMRDRQMNLVIHVEKEGEGGCWCGGRQGY